VALLEDTVSGAHSARLVSMLARTRRSWDIAISRLVPLRDATLRESSNEIRHGEWLVYI
jgi:hypothetical protein